MSEPYVDKKFYKIEYEGVSVDDVNFSRYAKRASDIIDSLTEHQIPKIGMDKFSEEVQLLIKKACCAQIEYYQVEGINLDITGNTTSSQSVSIGGFSYSGGANSVSRQANRVASGCLSFLEGTGLLRKREVGISVI